MIDSHCHLDCDAFLDDRAHALERAAARGVTDIVVPAVDEASWGPILALTRVSAPRCHAALGVHPVALPRQREEDDEAVLERLRRELRGVVAVGECGLDVTIDLEAAPLARQERVLLAQLELARVHALPVVLHARGHAAYRRLLEILEASPPEHGGVIHSYGGGIDLVRRYAALGLYFGFAGPATYANARKVRDSVRAVPSDRLLAETDAPDQTPEPHRPGRSEPAYVADVVRGLARALTLPEAEVAGLTAANARRLFKLASPSADAQSAPG